MKWSPNQETYVIWRERRVEWIEKRDDSFSWRTEISLWSAHILYLLSISLALYRIKANTMDKRRYIYESGKSRVVR